VYRGLIIRQRVLRIYKYNALIDIHRHVIITGKRCELRLGTLDIKGVGHFPPEHVPPDVFPLPILLHENRSSAW